MQDTKTRLYKISNERTKDKSYFYSGSTGKTNPVFSNRDIKDHVLDLFFQKADYEFRLVDAYKLCTKKLDRSEGAENGYMPVNYAYGEHFYSMEIRLIGTNKWQPTEFESHERTDKEIRDDILQQMLDMEYELGGYEIRVISTLLEQAS